MRAKAREMSGGRGETGAVAYYLTVGDRLFGTAVYLRLPEPQDLVFVQRLWQDPSTMADVGGPIRRSKAELRAWYRRMVEPGRPTDLYCLICLRQTHRPVGEVSFHRLDRPAMSAYLNLKVMSTVRRQGYARDALGAFLPFFFGAVGGQELLDDISIANEAGRGTLERLGFERDPLRQDVALMRMTRARFERLQLRP